MDNIFQKVEKIFDSVDINELKPDPDFDKRLDAEFQQKLPALRAKAERFCGEAIGAPFKVKLPSSTASVSGTIVACTVQEIVRRGRQVKCLYNVTMECGVNKVRRDFTVSAIPVYRRRRAR